MPSEPQFFRHERYDPDDFREVALSLSEAFESARTNRPDFRVERRAAGDSSPTLDNALEVTDARKMSPSARRSAPPHAIWLAMLRAPVTSTDGHKRKSTARGGPTRRRTCGAMAMCWRCRHVTQCRAMHELPSRQAARIVFPPKYLPPSRALAGRWGKIFLKREFDRLMRSGGQIRTV